MRTQWRDRYIRGRDVDDDDLSIHLLKRLPDQWCIFRVDDQNLGASMHERESDIRSVEARIQWIEYSSKHRYGKMGFDHLRNVRCDDRHGIEPFDPKLRQSGCEPGTAIKQLRVGIATLAVDHGHFAGEGACGAGQEADRRQRYVIGRMPVQVRFERMCVVCVHWISILASLKRLSPREATIKGSKPRGRRLRRSRFRSCRNQPPKPAAEAALRAPAIRQAAAVESA